MVLKNVTMLLNLLMDMNINVFNFASIERSC